MAEKTTYRRQQQRIAAVTPSAGGEAIGQSESFLALQERLAKIAAVDRPVLLVGERGTGKELAANRLHYLSSRWQGPLVPLNCATLSPGLLETELFGHEKGAFTGAETRRAGRFEAADGGTLFLDELGTIPREAQEKILRVVEYGCFERVGSAQPVEVDVRIIGATNADLRQMADAGQFMRDLLDRLSFEVVLLPPLREREEDILLLARHFAARMAFELGLAQTPEFSPAVCEILEQYPWPGNVRELKNVIERAVFRAGEKRTVDEIVFDPFAAQTSMSQLVVAQNQPTAGRPKLSPPGQSLPAAVAALEIDLLRQALTSARYNQRKTAAILGLRYDQLRGLLKKYTQELQLFS